VTRVDTRLASLDTPENGAVHTGGVAVHTTRRSSDAPFLCQLLEVHAVAEPRILDATYGDGVMWRGLPYRPTRMDLRPDLDLDVVGDWSAMPSLFGMASFDVVVFDPPHVTDAGDGMGAGSDWHARYGLDSPLTHGADNIAHLYGTFLHAARAVLVPKTGIVLAKIADQVHDRAQQWQHVDFVLAARAAGFTVCDYAIKLRQQLGPVDPRWQQRYHVPKPWSFWIVARAGSSCRGPGVARHRRCAMCGAELDGRRDALTCSPRCQKRRQRQQRKIELDDRGMFPGTLAR
jgi:hypothetical protein